VLQVAFKKETETRILPPMDRQNVYQVDPYLLEEAGELIGFSQMNTVATHHHPEGVEITVVSSDVADAGSMRIQGVHNGNEISETLALSGTTPVTSQYMYDEIYTLAKPTTTGYIRARTANSAETELQTLLADENARRHQRIQLHRDIGTTGHGLLVMAKRTCVPLLHDSDTPQLESSVNALCAYAVADMLIRMRQVGKAQAHVQEANAQVASMMGEDKNQRANVVRFIPEDSFSV